MKRIFLSFYLFVVIAILLIHFVFSPFLESLVSDHIDQRVGAYYRDVVSGYFYVLEKQLRSHPADQWEQILETLQPQFTFPLTIKRLETLPLTPAERNVLAKGEILVRGDGDLFRHQVGQTGRVLTMGPIPEFQDDFILLELAMLTLVILLMAIFALLWAAPFAHRLNRISNAAMAFGRGDFDARVQIPARSALAPMANAFNRMARRIQALMTSHKELTHAVSHELRTPITRIRFAMEMLATAPTTGEREHQLEGLRRDVDELEALVTEMLTYARFDRDHVHPELDYRPLAPWLTQLTATAAGEIGDHPINCRINLPDPDQPVRYHPRYLERALRNLIRNAARHTRTRIHLTLEATPKAIHIHVDDDGPGIPPQDRHRIFDPFVRLDTSRSRDSGGHGLGLAIVHRIIQWHGGTVEATTAPINGARFTLKWPGLEKQTGASEKNRSRASNTESHSPAIEPE